MSTCVGLFTSLTHVFTLLQTYWLTSSARGRHEDKHSAGPGYTRALWCQVSTTGRSRSILITARCPQVEMKKIYTSSSGAVLIEMTVWSLCNRACTYSGGRKCLTLWFSPVQQDYKLQPQNEFDQFLSQMNITVYYLMMLHMWVWACYVNFYMQF